MTVFLGCGFAAKYLDGGGNFSVPLQWMLGLRRLKLDAIWLEHMPSDRTICATTRRKIDNFQRQCVRTGSAAVIVCFIRKTCERRTISTRSRALEFQNANCSTGWPGRTRF